MARSILFAAYEKDLGREAIDGLGELLNAKSVWKRSRANGRLSNL